MLEFSEFVPIINRECRVFLSVATRKHTNCWNCLEITLKIFALFSRSRNLLMSHKLPS
jgi:hypothetical protein